MKFAILGTKPYYESDRILYEALKTGHEAIFLPKGNIIQTTYFNNGKFGIFFKPPTIERQVNNIDNLKDLSPILLAPNKNLAPIREKRNLLGKSKPTVVSNLFSILYFDAILLREMSKTLEFTSIIGSHLTSHSKVLVEQKIGSQIFYRSKHGTFYNTSSHGYPYPKSFAVTSKRALLSMLDYVNYPVIVKKSISSKGLGVYKCNTKEEVLSLIAIEDLKLSELLIQETIKYNGDIRVFVVGNKILGAMRREPQKGQWKGNVAQGAMAYPVELTIEQRKLALDVVKLQNSEVSGVDIMTPKTGPVLIETNRAPQFHGFEESMGINVAKEIVEYIDKRVENNNK